MGKKIDICTQCTRSSPAACEECPSKDFIYSDQGAEDIKLLLSLVPNWAKEVPTGLDSTMYGTGSYYDDLKIKEKIDAIKSNIEKHCTTS